MLVDGINFMDSDTTIDKDVAYKRLRNEKNGTSIGLEDASLKGRW